MNIAIFGASGFLGTNLSLELLKDGHILQLVTRRCNALLPTLADGVVTLHALNDLNSYKTSISSVLKDVEVVFVCFHSPSGGNPSSPAVITAERSSELLSYINTIAEAAFMIGAHLVYVSSGGSIYRDYSLTHPPSETSPLMPRSAYGFEKICAEASLLSLANDLNGVLSILRLANPFGPFQLATSGQGVIGYWLKSIICADPIIIFGDGSAVRDYIYVDDFSGICKALMASPRRSPSTYNIGGHQHSLSHLSSMLITCAQERGLPVAPPLHKDVDVLTPIAVVDSTRICNDYGSYLNTPMCVGLMKTLDWGLTYYSTHS
jgi:UDP-glucose 4-epimerase